MARVGFKDRCGEKSTSNKPPQWHPQPGRKVKCFRKPCLEELGWGWGKRQYILSEKITMFNKDFENKLKWEYTTSIIGQNWEERINMPQQYLGDVFHLGNDLRTTFAHFEIQPKHLGDNDLFYTAFCSELYIVGRISWPKGEKWSREKNGVSGFSAKKQYMAEERGRAEAANLAVDHAGWNVIIWRILDICIILHEPPSASDLG